MFGKATIQLHYQYVLILYIILYIVSYIIYIIMYLCSLF